MPTLDRITIYPVKSLDGVDVGTATVLPGGALEHDRRWRFVDMEGRIVNAKRLAILHAVRAEFALAERRVTLAVDPAAVAARAVRGVDRLASLAADTFPLVPGPAGPCEWVSTALGFEVLLQERAGGGFPDDRDECGPTLVTTESLAEVAGWYQIGLDECRRRFRVNLEVGGADAFWEDALACPRRPAETSRVVPWSDASIDPAADLPPAEPRPVRLGTAGFLATNVCRRCPVPSRDSRTGAATEWFEDIFVARRRQGLRPDVDASHWGTFYRLAVNTVGLGDVPEGITAGDPVT
jgi:hypothetical protein